MKIKFKSLNKLTPDKNRFEFTSFVEIGEWDNFKTYEFIEPSNKVMNRIEVSDNKVNIIAGPSYLNLVLNEDVENQYQTDYGLINLVVNMSYLEIKKDNINFAYKLYDIENVVIGDFVIELEFIK